MRQHASLRQHCHRVQVSACKALRMHDVTRTSIWRVVFLDIHSSIEHSDSGYTGLSVWEMTLRARKTDNGQGIRLSYLLYFAIVGLLSSSNAISLCGSGPHTLESDTLRLYAIAGQQTVIRAKFLSSQETINNIRWWTKPKTAQSLFEDSVTKQKGDTQVTLTMSKELNGVRIRYQMKYTSSDGRKRGFSSASATLIAGGTQFFGFTSWSLFPLVLLTCFRWLHNHLKRKTSRDQCSRRLLCTMLWRQSQYYKKHTNTAEDQP
jgi:hypothetical protein